MGDHSEDVNSFAIRSKRMPSKHDWSKVGCPSKLVSIRNNRKLEPKLRLFRLFRFYTQTESFDVSIEPKQTGDQPKQFYREHILLFCQHCFICRSSDSAVSEDAGTKLRTVATVAFAFRRSNHLARSRVSGFFVFFVFFRFFVFSVCFETVCFGCFASIPKQRVSIEPK
jgi:hypothetical protein